MNMVTMDKLVSLCKRRGFIYAGSEIYGGLANSWDYGPMGAQLKKNLKDSWWRYFVEKRRDMVGLDAAIIMNPKTWVASGHTATFNDPLVEDIKTNKRYRADHLLEEALGISTSGMSVEKMAELIREHKLQSPDGNELSEPRQFNLMFETKLGPTQTDESKVYLRPETAQGIFVNFKNVLDSNRVRLPFGIGQIGKAFRNEITPGNFTFRTLEFEQMEVEYFVEGGKWESAFADWVEGMESWGRRIGLDPNLLHRYEVPAEDLAHYSKRTIDFEYDFPFGRKELWGLAYRTDFDLTSHEQASGERLSYTDPNDNKIKFIPHVVEPSFGVDRTLLALLATAYAEEEVAPGDVRVVLRFVPEIAPVQVCVLPLVKKDELVPLAEDVYAKLVEAGLRTDYDDGGSVGKRYRRQDEVGTPYCVTVDFDSLEDQSVTIRFRDSMEQKRVKIEELVSELML